MTKQLHKLIHSLSKAEKRHFKIYTAGIAKNASYKRIFDAYEAAEEFDEKAILSKIGMEATASYKVTKVYLEEKILECLRNLHEGLILGKERDAQNHLASAKVCLDKGLLPLAEEHIEKCVALCMQYDLNHVLKSALQTKCDFWISNPVNSGNDSEELQKLIEEIRVVAEKQNRLDTLQHINFRLNFLRKGNPKNIPAGLIDQITAEIGREDEQKWGFTAKTLHSTAKINLLLLQNDLAEALNESSHLIMYWKKHLHMIKNNYPLFLQAYEQYVLLLIKNKRDRLLISSKIKDIEDFYAFAFSSLNQIDTWKTLSQNTTLLLKIEAAKDQQQHDLMLELCQDLGSKYQTDIKWQFCKSEYSTHVAIATAYAHFQLQEYASVLNSLQPFYEQKLKQQTFHEKVAIVFMYQLACYETNTQTDNSDDMMRKGIKMLNCTTTDDDYIYNSLKLIKRVDGKRYANNIQKLLTGSLSHTLSEEKKDDYYFPISVWIKTKLDPKLYLPQTLTS